MTFNMLIRWKKFEKYKYGILRIDVFASIVPKSRFLIEM